ncbi:MAG: DUF4136 domain-containing protein [Bacteroides sp.]|nr:DUF4136 domain-containing protein [Bacteroides sp.]
MKQLKLIVAALVFSLAGLLTGCYPDKIDYVDEYDVAGTMYDEDADFSDFMTFHVLDTVMHITEDGDDDPNLSREHDEYILGEIRSNMIDLGYTELESPDPLNMPDLEVFVQVMSTDFYTYFSYWYDYWGWYGGWSWWYPGYPMYPSYPWYPGGGGYVSSYSAGTLMIEMLDTESATAEMERPGMVWMGIVDGLLTNNSSTTRQRLDKQINQLFEQSPYLQQ